jgi:hypothetical protein
MKIGIIGVVTLFLCFGLLAFNISAVEIPVEVERVKDVCFVRVRGAHHPPPDGETKEGFGAFLLHYENLMRPPPGQEIGPQQVNVQWSINSIVHDYWFDALRDVPMDITLQHALIGSVMDFTINVYWGGNQLASISDSVVIPPA